MSSGNWDIMGPNASKHQSLACTDPSIHSRIAVSCFSSAARYNL